MIWSVLLLPPALSMNKSVSHHQGELWGEMRASVATLPDLHSAHEVTRVTSTVYSSIQGTHPFPWKWIFVPLFCRGYDCCWLGGKICLNGPPSLLAWGVMWPNKVTIQAAAWSEDGCICVWPSQKSDGPNYNIDLIIFLLFKWALLWLTYTRLPPWCVHLKTMAPSRYATHCTHRACLKVARSNITTDLWKTEAVKHHRDSTVWQHILQSCH